MLRPAADPSPAYWREFSSRLPTLGQAWIQACTGPGNPVLIRDTLGTTLKARQALTGSMLLAEKMRRLSPERNIGILLPASAGSILCNMACMLLGKTAVNLNFTAGAEALGSALEQAQIRTIYTSERFLQRLRQRGVDTEALAARARIVPLEELLGTVGKLRKALTLLGCTLLPRRILQARYRTDFDPDRIAVILFSSGSEGAPKGVMLSHRSLLANVKQTALLFRFSADDVLLASLPPFHAFGLTVTCFLPLLERVPVVCHADPTDVVGTAKAISEYGITSLFGTSSFFRLYVRNNRVRPEQLASLRLVVAGAERLQPETRRDFLARFGKEILEGYGATETAPVAAVNLPEAKRPAWMPEGPISKTGSVGPPLPGTSFRIVDPDSHEDLPTGTAGMVLISGPQLMAGYLNNRDRTELVLRRHDERHWYVTGDKGYLDEDGFLYIQDRYSRFAKIGGEMIGLGAVEQALRQVSGDPELELLVVSLPHERKGEQLVVLSTAALDARWIREQLLAGGLNALALPTAWFTVEAIPKLGAGKTDFAGARRLAETLLRQSADAAKSL